MFNHPYSTPVLFTEVFLVLPPSPPVTQVHEGSSSHPRSDLLVSVHLSPLLRHVLALLVSLASRVVSHFLMVETLSGGQGTHATPLIPLQPVCLIFLMPEGTRVTEGMLKTNSKVGPVKD